MRSIFQAFGFILMLFVSCSSPQHKLVIATAANVQFAMNDLTREFTEKTGIPCEMILGSSGKLTAQIRAGAPYDVFVSADMKYPEELHSSGLTTGEPEVYAYGMLVLWTVKDDVIPSMEILKDDRIIHIAVANPETAPYGEAALDALKKTGLYENIREKLVYGESIAQVNQFIISKTAEIGFTSRSVVSSREINGMGRWIEIDRDTYSPIAQGAVVIRHKDKDLSGAEAFYHFLFTEKAREILEKSGYISAQ